MRRQIVHATLRRAVLAAFASAALVVTASCSSGGGDATRRARSRGQSGSSATATTAAVGSTTTRAHLNPPRDFAAGVRALRAHMIDSIAGYTLQPSGASGTGPSDLARAAADAGGGAGPAGTVERAALTHAGFVAGYKLLFSASSDREILALAYRFATDAGARRYADRAFAARVHDGGAPSARDPSGVPGARVVERSESDASTALVLLTRGATLVILSTIQPAGTDAIALLDPIATAQYARLAGY